LPVAGFGFRQPAGCLLGHAQFQKFGHSHDFSSIAEFGRSRQPVSALASYCFSWH
jgi:hypothetical protein